MSIVADLTYIVSWIRLADAQYVLDEDMVPILRRDLEVSFRWRTRKNSVVVRNEGASEYFGAAHSVLLLPFLRRRLHARVHGVGLRTHGSQGMSLLDAFTNL